MASLQVLHFVIPCCKKKSISLCKPVTKKNLYVKKQSMVKIIKLILLPKPNGYSLWPTKYKETKSRILQLKLKQKLLSENETDTKTKLKKQKQIKTQKQKLRQKKPIQKFNEHTLQSF